MSNDLVQRLRAVAKAEGLMGFGGDETFASAADRIEALEGEVDTLKICIDAHVVASELGESMNEQLYREVQSANARAERLRVALEGMVHYSSHAEHWQDDNPQFVEAAVKALEDDKQ